MNLRLTRAVLAAALLFAAGPALSAHGEITWDAPQAGDLTHNQIVLRFSGGDPAGSDSFYCPTLTQADQGKHISNCDSSRQIFNPANNRGLVSPRTLTGNLHDSRAAQLRTDIEPETTYCFYIDFTTQPPGSDINCYTTAVDPAATAPDAPTPVTFGAVTHNSIVVNWAAPAANGSPIQHYEVRGSGGGDLLGPITVQATDDRTHTFTSLTADTEYTFTVTATNGAATSTAATAMRATPATVPVAMAGADQTVNEQTAGQATVVTLSGTGDAEAGDTTINVYTWEQVAANSDSAPVLAAGQTNYAGPITIQTTDASNCGAGATACEATFTVPQNLAAVTNLFFRLTVMDDDGMHSDRVRIQINAMNDPPMLTGTPTAAPNMLVAGSGVAVTLTGPAATDSDTPSLNYAWAQVTDAGGAATLPTTHADYVGTLTDANTRTAMFTAPEPTFTDANGARQARTFPLELYFRVTVSDNAATPNTDTAVVMVTVAAPSAGGTALDVAILPEVLRGTTHGIHSGIFQRILQRQRADGKWK